MATLIGLGIFATAYTAVGGLRAVIWTDVLQAVTLGAAVVVVLLLAVAGIAGGWSGLWQIGQEHGRWTMIHLESNLLAAENFTAPNSVYTASAFSLFMYLPGYAVAQNMIQRYVCTGGIRQARGVVVLSAVINAGLGFLFMLLGVALFAYYVQPAGAGMPTLESEDQILPYFVANTRCRRGTGGVDAGWPVCGSHEYRRQRYQRSGVGGRLRLAGWPRICRCGPVDC